MNGQNLVQGVYTWAVSLLRYSAAFIRRKKCELTAINKKTRGSCLHYMEDCTQSLMVTDRIHP